MVANGTEPVTFRLQGSWEKASPIADMFRYMVSELFTEPYPWSFSDTVNFLIKIRFKFESRQLRCEQSSGWLLK